MTNRRRESAGSANADAFDRDARVRSRNKTRAKGLGEGEELVGGMGVNMNVRNRLLIRFGVLTMELAMSFECWANQYSISSSRDRDSVGMAANPRTSENRGSRYSKARGREVIESLERGNSGGDRLRWSRRAARVLEGASTRPNQEIPGYDPVI